VVAGVNANVFEFADASVDGVEYCVTGVSEALHDGVSCCGDQFSSPSVQLSLSGLDFTPLLFDIRLALCDVRSGEGV
jgi:hypothetical protein